MIVRELTAQDGSKSRVIQFGVVEIQGGGKIESESDVAGMSIICTSLLVRSGGKILADRLKIKARTVVIEQSGLIDVNYQV